MTMVSVASAISAPAEMARESTKATVLAFDGQERVADLHRGVDAAAEGVDLEDHEIVGPGLLENALDVGGQTEIDLAGNVDHQRAAGRLRLAGAKAATDAGDDQKSQHQGHTQPHQAAGYQGSPRKPSPAPGHQPALDWAVSGRH